MAWRSSSAKFSETDSHSYVNWLGGDMSEGHSHCMIKWQVLDSIPFDCSLLRRKDLLFPNERTCHSHSVPFNLCIRYSTSTTLVNGMTT